ncbi:MAG TPA: acetolactate synthase small subunit [Kiritimatiellia bacterium]|nr:acetolactate synthase small subunit [Kiritimatiellia bacterium]
MTTSIANPHIAQSTGHHTISVYVANKPGVLARIAQVFARRGYNIESLVVSSAMDGQFSRMTIGLSGNPEGMEQIIKQTSKLIDVLRCTDHTDDDAVIKELALVKVGADASRRAEVLQIGEHFGCKTVDLTDTSMILQCTGNSEKIDALVGMLGKFRIIELVRTGKVLMARGDGMT